MPVPASAPAAHVEGVERFLASYRSIPSTAAVRLAKPTSNLFRDRAKLSTPGLDVSGLTNVISVDPDARTADVAGMCTYEDLVAATLPYGLSPLVVPQLKTITLGGAVAGLGIESASFRNGLPHESVLELDILTGTGELLTVSPRQHPDLFRTYPNSYGTLGYSTRLCIELEPVKRFVALRHVRFHSLSHLTAAMDRIIDTGEFDGVSVDYLDGVVFNATESYLSLGVRTGSPGPASDYNRTTHLLPLHPARHRHRRRPVDNARLLLAMGHRLVLVLRGFRRTEPPSATLVAAALPPQQRVLEAGSTRPAVRYRRPHRKAQWPSALANGWSKMSSSHSNARRSSWNGSSRRYRSLRSGCARCGYVITTAGRCIRSGRDTATSMSASGRRFRWARPMARRID